MSTLLVVETSPRGEQSISRQMTEHFVAQWRAAHPDGVVHERDLAETELPFVTAPWLQAYFTPPAQQSSQMREALRLSDELVRELLAADHLVIATPVYNYNVPAVLKAWIDQVVRKDLTLGLDGQGLLKGKKATLLLASGGVYTPDSPLHERDVATRYLKLILNVIGIDDVTVVAGGGAKRVDLGEKTMSSFMDEMRAQIETAAAQ